MNEFSSLSGQIDYVTCFRKHLNQISNNRTLPTNINNYTDSSVNYDIHTKPREVRATHPWDFEYKNKGSSTRQSYWSTATILPKQVHLELNPKDQYGASILTNNYMTDSFGNNNVTKGFILTKRSIKKTNNSDNTKDDLLNKYSPQILLICKKCHQLILPIWRELRNELKKNQILKMKGHIINHHFLSILNKFSINLSKVECGAILRSFRTIGMNDVVNYDEWFKTCFLVANSKI